MKHPACQTPANPTGCPRPPADMAPPVDPTRTAVTTTAAGPVPVASCPAVARAPSAVVTAAATAVATGGTAYVTCATRSFENGMGKWPSLFCRWGVNEEHGIGNNQK